MGVRRDPLYARREMTLPATDGLDDAASVVVAFTTEMNAWERRMNARSRLENGQFVRDAALSAAVAGLPYDGVMNEYYTVFQKHCTDRKRIQGGHPHSWSPDGTYAGASREAVYRCELAGRARAHVFIRAGQFPDQRFQFVLFLKAGGWRIDNAFSGSSDDGPWDRALI